MNRDGWIKEDFITYETLIILEAKIEKAREVAINLLLAGFNVEFVSNMVGLLIEEVEELPRYEPNDKI